MVAPLWKSYMGLEARVESRSANHRPSRLGHVGEYDGRRLGLRHILFLSRATKNLKSHYLWHGLTDFDEIWHGNTTALRTPLVSNFSKWWQPKPWKNQKTLQYLKLTKSKTVTCKHHKRLVILLSITLTFSDVMVVPCYEYCSFYRAIAMLSAVYAVVVSVCVCHSDTPVLYQNG